MIRRLEISDFEILASMYDKIFKSEKWKFDWLNIDNIIRYFTDIYNSPKFTGYTFIYNGRVSGACLGEISDYFSSVQYYIKEIFIELDLQNKGVGSIFLNEIECDLKKRGVNNMTLYTSKNIPAYKFYHKNGYVDSTESVYMVKFLND